MTSYARCNLGGRALHPDDQAALETFRIWLAMDEADRNLAIELDPEWREFFNGGPLRERQTRS
jgi:hypothetical protein